MSLILRPHNRPINGDSSFVLELSPADPSGQITSSNIDPCIEAGVGTTNSATTASLTKGPEASTHSAFSLYFQKWLGTKNDDGSWKRSPPRVSMVEVFWTFVGAFLGIGAVAWSDYVLVWSDPSKMMMVGSFGASAVLLFGVPAGPLSQPRNLIGGHVLSAVVGVLTYKIIVVWGGWVEGRILASALSVSVALALMQLTKTTHPPGGATALIAVIGSETVHGIGFMYVLQPVLSGALIMLGVALIVNNGAKERRYPQYWL